MSLRSKSSARGKAKPGTPRWDRPKPRAKVQVRRVGPPKGAAFLALGLEVLALLLASLVGTISVLGHAAVWFGGSDLTQSLLPFAGTVLILALAASLLLPGWRRLRLTLRGVSIWGPVTGALLIFFLALGYATKAGFSRDLMRLRGLVGGMSEAGRVRIAHEVYAAYRRADHSQLEKILERVAPFRETIDAAARHYQLDPEVLIGLGVTESSFLPRDSRDGGRGLFQITAIPEDMSRQVALYLGKPVLDPRRPVDNTYLAAATFRLYLDRMKGDLLLALLAYNIGPRNGGLLSIMTHYGAKDFFTIQPYLKDLPGDYPIRVLSAALAYRLYRLEGHLPPYEAGANAKAIQSIGIPGLNAAIPELQAPERARISN